MKFAQQMVVETGGLYVSPKQAQQDCSILPCQYTSTMR